MSVKCCECEAGCISFVTVPRYSHDKLIRLDGMRFTGMGYRRIKVKHLLRATARGRCLFSFIELFIVRKYYKKKILLFD